MMIEQFFSTITPMLEHIQTLGYWIAFFAAFLETAFLVGLFVPGSTLLLLLGAYATGGQLDWGILLFFAISGAILGDNLNYWIGRHFGHRWVKDGIGFITPKHFATSQQFFKKHGGKSIFLGRFVPTIKEIVPFIAGTEMMSRHQFLFWNILGAIGWGIEWLGAGYLFAQSLSLAQTWLSRVEMLIVTVIFIAFLLWLLQHQVIKHGRMVVEFAVSLWHSLINTFRRNKTIQKWASQYPRITQFIRQRLDKHHFKGRTLTLLSLAFLYVLVLFGGIIEDIITSDPIVALDKSIAQLVLAFREDDILQLFIWITELGNWQVAIPIAGFASLIFIAARRWQLIIPLMVSIVGSEVFTLLGKIAFNRPRPVEAVLYEHTGSFPSGHATIAVALYGFLGYITARHTVHWSSRIKILFFTLILIALLGLSRIMVGVHYVSDVWAGGLVGALWLIIAISLTEWLAAEKHLNFNTGLGGKRKLIVAGLTFSALAYYLGFATFYQPQMALPKSVQVQQLNSDLSSRLINNQQTLTKTLLGRPQQPISLGIIAKDDKALLDTLHQAGWTEAIEPTLHTVWQQITKQNTAKQTSVAPLFWNHTINHFILIMPEQSKQRQTTINILYLWKTNYVIGKGTGNVYVGMTRRYNGTKWLLLHTIDPDVDASREALLQSLQQSQVLQKNCKKSFIPAMTGQYLLKESFFTRGKLLEINLLDSALGNNVFCAVKESRP